MRVVIYARVSTTEQATSGDSLDTQRRQCEGYAMMKGLDVSSIFVEAGVSGSIPLADRLEGARMLAGLSKGDVVITAKLDRMFRNASDALGTLEEMKAQGVALHMIDLGGDVCGNGISKLVFTILSAVAENERDRIRERIRDVKRNLKAKGVYGGGTRPFGFDVDAEGYLVENAAEQASLADMKARRAQGESFASIGIVVGKLAMSVKRILDRIGT